MDIISEEINIEIKIVLEKIFEKRFNIKIENLNSEKRDCELIGTFFMLAPRDLIYLFFDIEKALGIKIPEKYIIKGMFRNINSITNMLGEILTEMHYKTNTNNRGNKQVFESVS